MHLHCESCHASQYSGGMGARSWSTVDREMVTRWMGLNVCLHTSGRHRGTRHSKQQCCHQLFLQCWLDVFRHASVVTDLLLFDMWVTQGNSIRKRKYIIIYNARTRINIDLLCLIFLSFWVNNIEMQILKLIKIKDQCHFFRLRHHSAISIHKDILLVFMLDQSVFKLCVLLRVKSLGWEKPDSFIDETLQPHKTRLSLGQSWVWQVLPSEWILPC